MLLKNYVYWILILVKTKAIDLWISNTNLEGKSYIATLSANLIVLVKPFGKQLVMRAILTVFLVPRLTSGAIGSNGWS